VPLLQQTTHTGVLLKRPRLCSDAVGEIRSSILEGGRYVCWEAQDV
jgi:hypothetical protein